MFSTRAWGVQTVKRRIGFLAWVHFDGDYE